MRIRMGVLAIALVASMAACSDDSDPKSDSDKPSSSDSQSPGGASETPNNDESVGTIDCPEFADIAAKIVQAQTELYSPSGGDAGAAIDDLVVELDGLKDGAPEDIQEALSELGDGFERAAELLGDTTQQGKAELVALVEQLGEAGQKINDYVAEQCS